MKNTSKSIIKKPNTPSHVPSKKSISNNNPLIKSSFKLNKTLANWPQNYEDRKKLFDKYSHGNRRFSYQFLKTMIDSEEIFLGISQEVLKKAMKFGDTSNDGFIDRKEFPYFIRNLRYFADLHKVFQKMDLDKDNKLKKSEFIDSRMALDPNLTENEAEKLFLSMDADFGGTVSYEEFCVWALKQSTVLQYNNKDYFQELPNEKNMLNDSKIMINFEDRDNNEEELKDNKDEENEGNCTFTEDNVSEIVDRSPSKSTEDVMGHLMRQMQVKNDELLMLKGKMMENSGEIGINEKIGVLEETERRLRAELLEKMMKIKEINKEKGDFEMEVLKLQEKLEGSSEKELILTQEIESYKKRLESLEKSLENEGEKKDLTNQIYIESMEKALIQQKDDFQEKSHDFQKKIHDFQRKLAEKSQKFIELEDLKTWQESKITDLHKNLQILEENLALKTSDIKKHMEKCKKEALAKDLLEKSLREDMERFESEKKGLEVEISEEKETRNEYLAKNLELIRELEGKSGVLNEKDLQMTKKIEEFQSLFNEKIEIERENQGFLEKISKMELLISQEKSLNSQILSQKQGLENRLTETIEEKDRKIKDFDEISKEFSLKSNEFEMKILELKQENNEIEAKYKEINEKNRLLEEEILGKQRIIEKNSLEIKEFDEKNKDLLNKIALFNENREKDLSEKEEALKEKNEAFSREFEALKQEFIREKQDLITDIEKKGFEENRRIIEKFIEECKEKDELLLRISKENEEKNNEFEGKYKEINEKNRLLEEEILAKQRISKEFNEKIRVLEEEIIRLDTGNQDFDEKNKDLLKKIALFNEEKQEFEAKLAQNSIEIKEKSLELARVLEEKSELFTREEALKEKNEAFSREIEALKQEFIREKQDLIANIENKGFEEKRRVIEKFTEEIKEKDELLLRIPKENEAKNIDFEAKLLEQKKVFETKMIETKSFMEFEALNHEKNEIEGKYKEINEKNRLLEQEVLEKHRISEEFNEKNRVLEEEIIRLDKENQDFDVKNKYLLRKIALFNEKQEFEAKLAENSLEIKEKSLELARVLEEKNELFIREKTCSEALKGKNEAFSREIEALKKDFIREKQDLITDIEKKGFEENRRIIEKFAEEIKEKDELLLRISKENEEKNNEFEGKYKEINEKNRLLLEKNRISEEFNEKNRVLEAEIKDLLRKIALFNEEKQDLLANIEKKGFEENRRVIEKFTEEIEALKNVNQRILISQKEEKDDLLLKITKENQDFEAKALQFSREDLKKTEEIESLNNLKQENIRLLREIEILKQNIEKLSLELQNTQKKDLFNLKEQLSEKEREILVFRENQDSNLKEIAELKKTIETHKETLRSLNKEDIYEVDSIVKQGKLDEETRKIVVDTKVIKFELEEKGAELKKKEMIITELLEKLDKQKDGNKCTVCRIF